MEFGLKYTIKIVINEFSTGLCRRRLISRRISYFTVGLSEYLYRAIKEFGNKGF